MGWKGALAGGVAGWCIGGFIGSFLGSVGGSWLENRMKQKEREEQAERHRRARAHRPNGQQNRARSDGGRATDRGPDRGMVFCACAAAMLAKLAKSDGVVSRDEIAAVERAFRRLGFSSSARAYAIDVFRRAKDDSRSIYEYAYEFTCAVPSVEVRELLYELLWDVACADGRIGENEMSILRQIPMSLGIRTAWFEYFARERVRGYYGGYQQNRRSAPPPRDPLSEAFELLGAKPSDDNDTLKRKYRDLAKKYHPDALRAQGLPDEMIGKANEKMAKINDAWSTIRNARGI